MALAEEMAEENQLTGQTNQQKLESSMLEDAEDLIQTFKDPAPEVKRVADQLEKEGDAEGDKKDTWLGIQPGKFEDSAKDWTESNAAKKPICNGLTTYDKCEKNTLVQTNQEKLESQMLDEELLQTNISKSHKREQIAQIQKTSEIEALQRLQRKK